jgi:hypothetical protein
MGQGLKGKILNPANNFNNPQEASLFRKSLGYYLNIFDFGLPAPNFDPSIANTAATALFTNTPMFIPHWVTQGAPGISNWNFSLFLSLSTSAGSSGFTMQPAIAINPVTSNDDIEYTQGAVLSTYNTGGAGAMGIITDDFGQTKVAPSADVGWWFSGINIAGAANCAALNHPFLLGIYNNNATGVSGDQVNIDRARIFIKFPPVQ